MCRTGRETDAANPRRCACSDQQRERYDAGRLMSRHGRRHANATIPSMRDRARQRFTAALDRYRTAAGMGEGQYPRVPAAMSAVSTWTPQRLDATPDAELDEQAMAAAESVDYWTAEVLCAEADRRQALSDSNPGLAEEEERRRYLNQAGIRRVCAWRDDPVTDRGCLTRADAQQHWREMYEEYAERYYADAESACNGHLLNKAGEAKRVHPRNVLSNPVLFEHYASEDLRRHMADGHPRLSFKAFQGDPAAREAATKRDQRL